MHKKLISKLPFLSIIIPLYNEEERLENLSKIYKYFDNTNLTYEVILINDGSRDKTLKKINELSKNFKFTLISYRKNKGKGFAIKKGMLKARGKYLLFTDIDTSTPIGQFNKFIPYLKKIPILIASRRIKGAQLVKRQSYPREILGVGFTFLSQKILGLPINDFTCGFKCFSKKAAVEVFNRQKIYRWGFDSEILFIAKKFGFKIQEIPVKWSNDPGSRVKFPQDIIKSLRDLYAIRLNEIKGKYE